MNFGFFIETKHYRFKIETLNICDCKNNCFKPTIDICDYPDIQMKRISKFWYIRPFGLFLGKKIYY